MGLNQSVSGGRAEKRLDCGYIVNIELTGFLGRSDLGCERRRSIKVDSRWLGHSNWNCHLMKWVRLRKEQIQGRQEVFRLAHLKALDI